MLSAFLNNPSGGLRYHVRALRHRNRSWAPFRAGLETWLSSWTPRARTLAVVGPSAGYCLPLRSLARFERFVLFEPDPIARMLLRRRLRAHVPRASLTFVAHDVWIAPLLRGGSLPTGLLGQESALLFSNIIGQLAYLVPDDQLPRWSQAFRAQLFPLLERVPWASFHDRVSGATAPPAELPQGGARLRDDELQALYAQASQGEVRLNDHGSSELLPSGYSYSYFHWPLTSGAHHLIEAVLGGPR